MDQGRTSPIDWALRPLRRYADFRGRAPRAEYWWYSLMVAVVGGLLGMADVKLLHGPIYGDYGALGLPFTVAVIVPGFAVLIRRLHDTDNSGWWAVLHLPGVILLLAGHSPIHASKVLSELTGPLHLFVSLGWAIASLALFVFTVIRGTDGQNRYGPDPYGPSDLEEVFA